MYIHIPTGSAPVTSLVRYAICKSRESVQRSSAIIIIIIIMIIEIVIIFVIMSIMLIMLIMINEATNNNNTVSFQDSHVCFCGLDPGNLKFETVRTQKQHICV